jgi:hypothetical protein
MCMLERPVDSFRDVTTDRDPTESNMPLPNTRRCSPVWYVRPATTCSGYAGCTKASRSFPVTCDLTADLWRKLRCDNSMGPSTKLQEPLPPREIARMVTKYGTECRGPWKPMAIRSHHWNARGHGAARDHIYKGPYDVHTGRG